MSQFNLDEEYAELMMVSGFVWILAAVFTLAPLLACLSCYVIIRGCTMKLLVSCRRPWPMKRYDIGSWCAATPAGRAPRRIRLGSIRRRTLTILVRFVVAPPPRRRRLTVLEVISALAIFCNAACVFAMPVPVRARADAVPAHPPRR